MGEAPRAAGSESLGGSARRTEVDIDKMLNAVPWYLGLPELERKLVRADLRVLTVGTGGYLFRAGASSPGWLGVIEGLVKWSSSGADGRSLSIAGFGAGSWFGEATMIRRRPFEYDVVALRPSRLVVLPRDTCERLWNSNIEFTKALMKHLAQRVDWLMGSYTANLRMDVDNSVARAIAAQFDSDLHSGTQRNLRLSQEEIASLCGISRQRCNAALTRLARAGLLVTHYGGLTVIDMEELCRLAKIS